MKHYESDNEYILKIEKGEYFMQALTDFCNKYGIENAYLSGIGAVEWVRCGYYDLPNKEYLMKEYDGIVEVTNVTGNIMLKEGTPFVHAHGTFSNRENEVFGGHIEDMRVGVVLEIILRPTRSNIERTHDEDIGLNLMDI